MKILSQLLLLSLMLSIVGCRTGGVILRETPMNVSETRRIIVAVMGEPRSVSQNGRELLSKYYDKNNKQITNMDMARQRLYTHVTVLGDRRPYDVQVEVLVEERSPSGSFEMTRRDDVKAADVAEKIRQTLNQSRDNRNIIDDFRSF